MSIMNRGRELEKNLESRSGLSDRRGVRGRQIEREKSMDDVTRVRRKCALEEKRERALAQKVMILAEEGESKRRGDRR